MVTYSQRLTDFRPPQSLRGDILLTRKWRGRKDFFRTNHNCFPVSATVGDRMGKMLAQPQKLYPGWSSAFVPSPLSKGGKHCLACPFFHGGPTRDGKDCVSCPRRLFAHSRREVERARGGILATLRRALPVLLAGGEPSDGHPQEELTPDFCWFRPLAHNNQTWVLYWPDLAV
jgi:hypothetical protein